MLKVSFRAPGRGPGESVGQGVEGEDQADDAGAWQQGEVGVAGQDGSVVVADEVAPAGHGNLSTDAHEAQSRLDEDGGGKIGAGQNGNGPGEVG